MTLWILMIYLIGYDAAPVRVSDYTTLASCEAAAKTWATSGSRRGKAHPYRAWACIPDR